MQIDPNQPPTVLTPQRPTRPEGALAPYLRAIRAHALLVPLITLAALAGSVVWLELRSPQYEGKAEVLVSPLPQDDQTFLGIQILRDSPGDPTRAVQTAATLVDSPLAARAVATRLRNGWTLNQIEDTVKVEPEGQSDILAVTARAGSPALAARIANLFATSALQVRSAALKRQVASTLSRLEARQRALRGNAVARADLADEINQLQAIESKGDPTLSLLQPARPPTSAVGAPGWLVVVLATIAGFMLATGTALLLEFADRRVRDQDELLELYPLPVLARVPPLPGKLRKVARVSPRETPPAVREAFRTLVVQLEQRRTGNRTVMVTSASSQDGKTSSAANLAFQLVGSGHRVVLIDLDLRKPGVADALGIESERSLVSLLSSDTSVSDLMVPAPELPPLGVIPAGGEGDIVLLEALVRRLPEIVAEAQEVADYVVLDTAPLGEVSDALRMADAVDDILIVSRPGHTHRANFELMRDLLSQTGRVPAGHLVLGVSTGGTSSYYAYGLLPRRNGSGRVPVRPTVR